VQSKDESGCPTGHHSKNPIWHEGEDRTPIHNEQRTRKSLQRVSEAVSRLRRKRYTKARKGEKSRRRVPLREKVGKKQTASDSLSYARDDKEEFSPSFPAACTEKQGVRRKTWPIISA